MILDAIRYASKSNMEDEDGFREKVMTEHTSQRKDTARELEARLNRDRKRCTELDALIQSLYESNFSGKISDKRFKMMSDKYEQEQAEADKLKEKRRKQREASLHCYYKKKQREAEKIQSA